MNVRGPYSRAGAGADPKRHVGPSRVNGLNSPEPAMAASGEEPVSAALAPASGAGPTSESLAGAHADTHSHSGMDAREMILDVRSTRCSNRKVGIADGTLPC